MFNARAVGRARRDPLTGAASFSLEGVLEDWLIELRDEINEFAGGLIRRGEYPVGVAAALVAAAGNILIAGSDEKMADQVIRSWLDAARDGPTLN